MKCKVCGKDVSIGAKFCPHCGNAVTEASAEVPTETRAYNKADVPAEVNTSKVNSNPVEAAAAIQGLNSSLRKEGFSQNADVVRMNRNNRARSALFAAEDREANADLFELYSRLITPVQAMEILDVQKNSVLMDFNQKRSYEKSKEDEINESYKWKAAAVFVLGILFLDGSVPLFFVCVVAASIYFILSKNTNDNLKKTVEKLKRRNDDLEILVREQINKYDAQMTQIRDAIATSVAYVPPKYRTSECLNSMVEDYYNCRVDNLKEAVANCDKVAYQNRVLESLRRIEDNTARSAGVLENISDQLNLISGEVAFAEAASMASIIVATT